MKKFLKSILFLAAIVLLPSCIFAAYPASNAYQPFAFSEVVDVNNQPYVGSWLGGKPLVILTAARACRYEVLKWAKELDKEFADIGAINVLWVVNASRYPKASPRGSILAQWRAFKSPVPILVDWNNEVAGHLPVDYQVPNIIIYDSYGNLLAHEKCCLNIKTKQDIFAYIRGICGINIPAIQPVVTQVPRPYIQPVQQVSTVYAVPAVPVIPSSVTQVPTIGMDKNAVPLFVKPANAPITFIPVQTTSNGVNVPKHKGKKGNSY